MTTRRPSVVFFNRVYPPSRGASGRMLRDLAHAFAARGWDVTVVTSGPKSRREYDGPVKIVRIRAPLRAKRLSAYLTAWIRMFWAGLNLPARDLIVTMTDPPLLVVAGRLIAALKKSRHIHWCQDLYPDILPVLGFSVSEKQMDFFRKLSRKAMKKCDKVIAIGRCMAIQLTHGGVEPRRVAVIPNWPDYELLPGNANIRPRRPLRKVSDAQGARPFDQLLTDGAQRKFRVLYSGNLGRAHPVDAVLDAAAILGRDHPEIEFVFVGDGAQHERLAEERARRNLENVRLMPFQPASRLRELMESGDLHLITMKHESAGMLVPCKLYAALAVARPCILIGPENSEIARVINDFGAGSIVAQGAAENLAAEILAYRRDAEKWFAAHQGAAEAGSVFVPAQSCDAWIKRARDVVNQNDRRNNDRRNDWRNERPAGLEKNGRRRDAA